MREQTANDSYSGYSYDHEWIRALREGDHEVFESLFRKYFPLLTRFVWRYISSEAIARELVQELFADLWEKRKDLEIHGAIRPYLYKTAKNRALNHLKRDRMREAYDYEWISNTKNREKNIMFEFEDQAEFEQIQKIIGKAVEELPQRSRMTYKLHRYDGLTYEEIAEVMNISVKTVESQMTRTLKILRNRLSIFLPFLLVALLAN